MRVWKHVPLHAELDTWFYRSYGVDLYGASISTFYYRRGNHMAILNPSALLFERTIFRADFRVSNKKLTAYYVDYIKW